MSKQTIYNILAAKIASVDVELSSIEDLYDIVREAEEIAVNIDKNINSFDRVDIILKEAQKEFEKKVEDYKKGLERQFENSIKRHAEYKANIKQEVNKGKSILPELNKIAQEFEKKAKELGVAAPNDVVRAKQAVDRINRLVNKATTYVK